MSNLPEPECPYGYPVTQVENLLGSRTEDFWRWMRGQTIALCDGREYDYARREYSDTGHRHGTVVYASDVRTFLAGGEPLD